MGNRATIEVKDFDGYSAACYAYTHWNGSPEQVINVVLKAAPVMRPSDCGYAMARLIGTYHQEIAGGLSLGVVSYKEKWDNGHYVVNMGAGTITNDNRIVHDAIEFGQSL